MKFLFLILTFVTCSIGVWAQTKTYKNEAGFETDNDSYLAQGSDRYYTAGNFGYFRHGLKVNDTSAMQNKVLGFEFGQRIYNSQSGSIPDVRFVDRPFAGYLYIGANLNLLYKNESNLKLISQIGITGPNAYGYEIQNVIHKVFGFYQLQGWQYQVQNDFEINLSAEYNRLLYRTGVFDLTLNTTAALGNGYTGAGIGGMARLGTFNRLFNSISTASTVTNGNRAASLNDHELFFYYKPSFNYIAYNATIQGSLFNSTRGPNEITLNREPFMFSNQIGASLVKDHWVVDLSAIIQTKEVKEMVHNGHQWGAATFLYRFN
jgi:lipid A 3-O-deacylase